jgi:hypothetical protein
LEIERSACSPMPFKTLSGVSLSVSQVIRKCPIIGSCRNIFLCCWSRLYLALDLGKFVLAQAKGLHQVLE